MPPRGPPKKKKQGINLQYALAGILLVVSLGLVGIIFFGGKNTTKFPDDFTTAIHEAAAKGDEAGVTALLDKNGGLGADALNKDGVSPLMSASQLGHLNVVLKLLANGANPNRKQPDVGLTPLRLAASRNQIAVVTALLRAGADVNLLDHHGYSPLMLAALGGYKDCASVLLQNGANPSFKDKLFQLTASGLARTKGFNDLADILQKKEVEYESKSGSL